MIDSRTTPLLCPACKQKRPLDRFRVRPDEPEGTSWREGCRYCRRSGRGVVPSLLPYVYALINPARPGWVKIGYSSQREKTLLSRYNVACPLKAFAVAARVRTDCVDTAQELERQSLQRLSQSFKRSGEWIRCSVSEAKAVIYGILEEHLP